MKTTKSVVLITSLMCVFISALPSFAQQTSGPENPGTSGSGNTSANGFMFNSPNYWGDSRVKNRQVMPQQGAQSTPPPMASSGARNSGGGGISALGMLYPMTMVARPLAQKLMHPNMGKKARKEREKREKYVRMPHSKSYDPNQEYSQQPRTQMQAAAPRPEEMRAAGGMGSLKQQEMSVSGMVENPNGPAPGEAF